MVRMPPSRPTPRQGHMGFSITKVPVSLLFGLLVVANLILMREGSPRLPSLQGSLFCPHLLLPLAEMSQRAHHLEFSGACISLPFEVPLHTNHKVQIFGMMMLIVDPPGFQAQDL